jgi:hypothetical protein
MLATLPSAPDLVAEQKLSSSTREAVGAAVATIHGSRSDTVVLKAVGAAILSGSALAAVARRRWEPLLVGVVLILLVALSGMWFRRRRIAALKKRMFAARAKPDFSDLGYVELVAGLAWEPIPRSEKERLLTCFSDTADIHVS